MAAPTQHDKDDYLAAFYACLSREKASAISDRARVLPLSTTTASLHTRHEHVDLALEDVCPPDQTSLASTDTVLVVENISSYWIAALGIAWNVAPTFFAEHASNPNGNPLWHAVFGTSALEREKPVIKEITQSVQSSQFWDKAHYWNVDGILRHSKPESAVRVTAGADHQYFIRRQGESSNKYGSHISTRISFWRSGNKTRSLCLILVDTLCDAQTGRDLPASLSSRAQLHLPVSRNRGGLLLPQLFEQHQYSLYQCLGRFLSHAWHFNALFSETGVVLTPETFLYLVVCSTWNANFQFLDRDIKQIGFQEIRKPSTAINNRLHDRRQDLNSLQKQVELAKTWIPTSVNEQLGTIKTTTQDERSYIGLPDEMLIEILKRHDSLERFLMDSFNLLITSTSVLEAELAIEQGVRGQILTTLAFVYIPLSFVTGVFGMNVKEINGSPLSVWVPVVAAVITAIITAVVFLVYAQKGKHRV